MTRRRRVSAAEEARRRIQADRDAGRAAPQDVGGVLPDFRALSRESTPELRHTPSFLFPHLALWLLTDPKIQEAPVAAKAPLDTVVDAVVEANCPSTPEGDAQRRAIAESHGWSFDEYEAALEARLDAEAERLGVSREWHDGVFRVSDE